MAHAPPTRNPPPSAPTLRFFFCALACIPGLLALELLFPTLGAFVEGGRAGNAFLTELCLV